MSFPLRPGNGRAGKTCTVRANHFDADVMPYLPMYQYHVRIKPQVRSRDVNRAVMARLVKLYRDSHLGSRLPAYDGSQILYTAGPLPFYSQEFTITLLDEGDGPASPRRRECDFRVVIELASCAPASLQSLNVVLREFPTLCHRPVGRSFYHRRELLGPRLELWRGFYQSVRPTQMGLSLNVDISSSAFIQALPVIEFVGQLLDRRVSAVPLSDSDRAKIMKALKGVRVEVTHRGKMRKKYRISGLTSQTTRELNFPVGDRGTLITLKSVVEYFWEAYGFSIQHVQLPCLQVGNTQRPFYLPMEVCKIVDGQRYSNRLNETQIKALLKVTHQPPQKREAEILKAVRDDAYGPDPYAREFGIQISTRLASVEARILPPPRLKYHDIGRERDCLPSVGRWDMRNKKLVNGGTVDNWMCINFSRNVPDNIAKDFCTKLAGACNYYGMDFNIEPVLPLLTTGRPDQVESVLKACFRNAMTKLQSNRKALDLLIVILPDNNRSLYGDVKRICETDLGIVSQCCKAKKVIEMSDQYVSSILLKINVKVGGRNTVLADALYRRIPNVSDVPTIIFGADVTHPHAGDESSPSIAAVVASQDWPEITKYAGLVSAQAPRQELIQDLFKEWQDPNGNKVSGGMIKELLMSFVSAVGRKPKRIIFYRDGVSEGQFYQVLLSELHAIRMACASLDPNERDYMPPVTFIVVVKRHHTRLFAANHEDRDDKGNILPGTVVDTKICHPTMFDFYLCSHAAIKGTSRPAHYHVLWDENQFSADALQLLTNDLCYTHARCTSSVSIVPPVYYAHLAAYRARCYMEPDTSHSGSVVSRHAHGANAAVRPLPAVKDNVKRVMYYV